MQLNSDRRTKSSDLPKIRAWFDSPLGQELIGAEKAVIEQLLPGLFGYHLVQLGVTNQLLADSSPINHKITMGIDSHDKGSFRGSAIQLPFANDSIDVVLVHHLLDFYTKPEEILKEIGRVSLSSGYLVVVGFNPVSLWGLWKTVAQWSDRSPWNGSYILPSRLMDWMNLLNFRIDRIHYTINGFPLITGKKPRIPDYSGGLRSNWPFGAVYTIVARKMVGGITPVRPVWKVNKLPKLSVVRPSSRGISQSIDGHVSSEVVTTPNPDR